MPCASLRPLRRVGRPVILTLAAFLVLAAALASRPARSLMDFDQPFYIAIAYDLDRHGVFSNGIFSGTDSTREAPAAGMFFGPVYPLLVLTAMQIDPRFAAAVRCSVEADRGHRDQAKCEPYATPMRIIHALLLALGVLAIAAAGEQMFRARTVFWLAGALATIALAAEADIFSFIMTESIAFCLYSTFALTIVLVWTTARLRYFILAGGLLGILCLTRPSFLVLFPVVAGLSVLQAYRLSGPRRPFTTAQVLGFTLAFAAAVGAWSARNAVSVGKLGLTEEYGSAALIERFAYDDMTAREFFQAFPYCVPGIGDLGFDLVYGTDSMHRFVFHTPDSFFHTGRDRRDALVAEHGRLDPLIGGIIRDELRANWWRYLLVGIPLAWCGMWAGWLASLILIPLFACACVRAVQKSQPLLLLYAAPAIAMLGLHAAVANQTTRYNLILIGPFAAGAAWIICAWLSNVLGSRVSAPLQPSFPASPSHHRPGGGYRNPWPQTQSHSFADFLRWRLVGRRARRLDPNPPRDSLPKRQPAIVAPRAAPGYRSVTWVGHSTALLQLGSLNVLTDPIWSERASPLRWIGPRRLMAPAVDFNALPPIDVVLLSHNHYDHLDAATVRRIAYRFPDAAWLCPLGLASLLQTFGVRHALERDWWQSIDTPAYAATCAPAQHFSSRGLRDRCDTLWCGWSIAADDVRVYFGGDTGLHPEFGPIGTRLGPFDLVMLPIGAYEPRWFMRAVHLDPQDAIAAYGALTQGGGATAPPCLALHWGTFRLTDEPLDEPPAQFAQRWREAGLPESANWTLAHGETRRIGDARD